MGLPAWVEDCPEYRVKSGRMHIAIGELALTMPINVFLEGCLKGKEAIAQWQIRELCKDRAVIPFRGD